MSAYFFELKTVLNIRIQTHYLARDFIEMAKDVLASEDHYRHPFLVSFFTCS